MCRNPVRPFKAIETNVYGFASAVIDIPDIGQGWRAQFVHCMACMSRFVAVLPRGMRVCPCVFCENQQVYAR